MPTPNLDRRSPEKDAAKIEDKYGAFAGDYAQSRSEAADLAGNEGEKVHWEEIADRFKREAGE